MTAEFVLLCSNLVAKPGRKYLDNTHCPSVELNISGVTLPTLPNIKVTYRVLQTDLHHTNIFSFPAKNTGGSWIENHRHTQCSSKDQRKTSLYSAVRSVLCPLSLTVITRSSQIVLKLVTSNTWWIETVSCTLRKVTMTTGTSSWSGVRTLLTMS